MKKIMKKVVETVPIDFLDLMIMMTNMAQDSIMTMKILASTIYVDAKTVDATELILLKLFRF